MSAYDAQYVGVSGNVDEVMALSEHVRQGRAVQEMNQNVFLELKKVHFSL